MSSDNDYSIYECLVREFQRLDDVESKKLAHHLTEQLNVAIAQNNRSLIFNRTLVSNDCAESIERLRIQPLSLSLPWQAYYDSISNIRHLSRIDGLQSILATIPDEYSLTIPTASQFGHPYAGSLIQKIADLINTCQSTLLIVNPYWSQEGINQLKTRITNHRLENREVTILLPSKLDTENQLGLDAFVNFLEQLGFKIIKKTPQNLSDGSVPFVHAKVVITDSRLAYIGSANMSLNGFRKSIEAGVVLEGSPAKHLQQWFKNLSNNFFIRL